MTKSMFDQLKKTGLVDKQKAHKVRAEKQRQIKQQRKSGSGTPTSEVAEQAVRLQQEKRERDRKLNAEREAAADSKAVAAQIKQLIEAHRQDKGVKEDSEQAVGYNFADQNMVKQIRVSSTVQQQLVRGQLAIVKYIESYALVPAVVAEKILTRDQNYFVLLNEKLEVVDEDDPYKDYKIPDDLMW